MKLKRPKQTVSIATEEGLCEYEENIPEPSAEDDNYRREAMEHLEEDREYISQSQLEILGAGWFPEDDELPETDPDYMLPEHELPQDCDLPPEHIEATAEALIDRIVETAKDEFGSAENALAMLVVH